MKIFLQIIGVALFGLALYSWTKHSDAEKEEKLHRYIFGKAFLYNMLPEHLPVDLQKKFFAELLEMYLGKFGKIDWEKDLESGTVSKKNFALIYTLAYYQKTLAPTIPNKELFKKATALLKQKNKVKTNSSPSNYASTNFVSQQNKTTNEKFQTQNQSQAQPQQKYQTVPPSINELYAKQEKPTKAVKQPNQPVEMVLSDVNKLYDAQKTLTNQLLMLSGFILFGLLLGGFIMANRTGIIPIVLCCVALYGGLIAYFFIPDYSKIGKDLKNRRKIKIKVQIKDLQQEAGTAYLVLKPNAYNIKTITAPAKYYTTALLNKNLEVYVAKESHTLLEVLEITY